MRYLISQTVTDDSKKTIFLTSLKTEVETGENGCLGGIVDGDNGGGM